MELKSFVGKVVISAEPKRRYVIRRITAFSIEGSAVEKDARGYHASYCWSTINGDPISNGVLTFEDTALTEPFKKAYEAYSHTEDAYWENVGYWMRRC